MSATNVDDTVTAMLHQVDQRYTTSRRRLVASLQTGEGPLTITQIVDADETLPQSTIYRNLNILEEAGVVTRVTTSDGFSRYELTEELTGHHHHLICTNCDMVTDFTLDTGIESVLEKALAGAARKAGFQPGAHRLDLLGTCKACR